MGQKPSFTVFFRYDENMSFQTHKLTAGFLVIRPDFSLMGLSC